MTSTPIVVGDAIYGLNSYGELRGVDATTGERLWSSDRLVTEDRLQVSGSSPLAGSNRKVALWHQMEDGVSYSIPCTVGTRIAPESA